MNHFKSECLLFAVLTVFGLSSCVDDDYDLSKDIDMNVSVGGDLTLPPSSTDTYSMGQILSLDASSSIKPDGEKYGLASGDYVLSQNGEATSSSIHIDAIELHNLRSATTSENLTFVQIADKLTANVENLTNYLSIKSDDVDRQVVSLKSADVSISFDVQIYLKSSESFNAIAVVERGFKIEFPQEWTLKDSQNDNFSVENDRVIVFNKDVEVAIGGCLNIPITVSRIDLSNVGEGQGIYEPGHFNLDVQIVSNGNVYISDSNLDFGDTSDLILEVIPVMNKALVTGFEGKVNPEININSTSFEITGIPDFLKDGDDCLDIQNPQFKLIVENSAPVEVNVNACLEGVYDNKDTKTVWIGDAYGTEPILIKANGRTVICISRLGEGANTAAGEVNVKVPNLNDIIETIPNRISLNNITAVVPQDKDYTVTLNRTFNVDVDYTAIVPLAFGPELRFTYTTNDTGWDSDLDKYNFSQVRATVAVENSIPLNMVPSVYALGKNGQVLSNITATIEGSVSAGTLSNPTSSNLVILLNSTAANMGDLDGIEFEFAATSASEYIGVPLNENQTLKFNEIRLQLVGGVDIDLN